MTDGAQGVRHAVLLRPDVVTMDFDMPVMDGIEATRRIIEALPETRVVLVSGSQYQDHVASAREAGAAGYLAKSRVADQLVDTLVEVAAGAEFVLRV